MLYFDLLIYTLTTPLPLQIGLYVQKKKLANESLSSSTKAKSFF